MSRLGGAVYHRHEWLAVLESVDLVEVEASHLVVRRAGRITGLAPMYRTIRCPKFAMFQRHYLTAAGLDTAQFVVGHSMYGQSSQILAETAEDRLALLRRTEESRGPAQVTAFPLVPADDPLFRQLVAEGYDTGLLACTNFLDVEWPDFDGYLASRPSAKRRNIRRGIEDSERLGLRCETGVRDVPEIAQMVLRTARHHQSPVFFDRQYLERIFDELAGLIETFRLTVAGRTVLTCVALADGTELLPWCIGFEYESLGQYGHYNYLYAELIRYAAERRYRRINLGRGTYYIKRKYGYNQRPVYAAMRTEGPLRAPVASWLRDIDLRARDELAEHGLTPPLPDREDAG